MRFVKSCKNLTIRTDASKIQILVMINVLKRLGWKWVSLGRPLNDPDSKDTEVRFIKEPTYYTSPQATIRALDRKNRRSK